MADPPTLTWDPASASGMLWVEGKVEEPAEDPEPEKPTVRTKRKKTVKAEPEVDTSWADEVLSGSVADVKAQASID